MAQLYMRDSRKIGIRSLRPRWLWFAIYELFEITDIFYQQKNLRYSKKPYVLAGTGQICFLHIPLA